MVWVFAVGGGMGGFEGVDVLRNGVNGPMLCLRKRLILLMRIS